MAAPDDDRLDELEDKIERAREQAEDHGTLPEDDAEQTFADPDGDGDVDPPNVVGV